jgi:hypothetical protein
MLNWEKLISRCSMRDFPIRVSLAIHCGEGFGFERQTLQVILFTRDSTGGSSDRRFAINHSAPCPPLRSTAEKEAVRWVYYQVIKALEHEVGEFFRFDSELPFNPHVERENK